jgi:FlaA1/EpsC-like NDP-sugar epimerase
VAISSLAAATNGNAIAESLRNTELFLQEFFRGSNCRLVIPRICDVIENRGGTVSVLENQIKNHEAITLSSTDGGVYLISKHSAAEFVLQTMVETIKNGQDLLVKYIDSSPPNTDKPRVIEQSAPTSHPHIRFIKETGTFSNHESRESLLKFLASNNLT